MIDKKRRVFGLFHDLYSFLYIWEERNLQLSTVLCKSTQEKSAPTVSNNYTTYSSYIALLVYLTLLSFTVIY